METDSEKSGTVNGVGTTIVPTQPGQTIRPSQPIAPSPAVAPAVSPAPPTAPAAPAAAAEPKPAYTATAPVVSTDATADTVPKDTSVGSVVDEPRTEPAPAVNSAVPYKPSRAMILLRKFWYIALAVAVLAGVLIFLQSRHAAQEQAWKDATNFYTGGNYDRAAQVLEGFDMPTDPVRLKIYAQAMLATRQLDKAVAAYGQLYEMDKDLSVRLIIGNIYTEQKKNDDAAKIYQEIIDADKNYIQAYINLATLDKQQGKLDEARAITTKGIEANPKNITLQELRVSLLLDKKGSADYNAAVASLRALNPTDPLLDALD